MKPKVLIIEDDVATTKFLQFILEGEGFHAEVALSGIEGLEKIPVFGPQLLLLDVMMPGMDGYEVCRKLKDAPEAFRFPIVFLSAKALQEDVERGFSMGADDYITKPFTPPDLVARLRKVMERYAGFYRPAPAEGEEPAGALQIISRGMNSFTKWDLVKFLYEHAPTSFSLGELAKILRRDREQLRQDLHALTRAGFCRQEAAAGDEYQFAGDASLREEVEDFFRFCRTEQGRIKAVCQILQYETGMIH